MRIKNLKVFLLYIAAVFLCIHNFIPHNHAEFSVVESAAHHHGEGQQHNHESPPVENESKGGDPLELPSHQESVAKYIIKHHSEQTLYAPGLLYYTHGVYALNQSDPIALTYSPAKRNYGFHWDFLLVSSSYLRGPPSFFLS